MIDSEEVDNESIVIKEKELVEVISNYIEENELDKIKKVIETLSNYEELNYNKKLLITAIQEKSNNTIIEYFIDKEKDVNYEISLGKTPFGEALNVHNYYIADILLKKGADINYVTSRNKNILFYLKESKDNPLNKRVLKYLINNKVDFNKQNNKNKNFIESLILEKNKKMVELLFSLILFDNEFILNILLETKNNRKYSKKEWDTKINNEYNKIQINKDVIKTIINDDDNEFFNLILKHIPAYTDNEIMNNMLHDVCRAKKIDYLKKLIEKGVNVNDKEKNILTTPLMDLSYIEKGLKRKGLNQCIYDMFELLLKEGADINAKDKEGKTALMYILRTKKASVKLIKLLVQYGAKINDICENGCSPLIFACEGDNKYVLKNLLMLGADTNIVSNDSMNIFIHAAKNGCLFLVQYLFDNGIIKNLNCVDQNLETPLIYAVRSKNINLVKYLVENGANVNLMNKNKESPLSIILSGRIQKKAMAILNCLLDHGAVINRSFKFENNYYYKEQTPLNYVITRQNFELTKLLIEKGADINMKDDNGKTPLFYAVKHLKKEEFEIIEYLLKKGAFINEIINDNNETILFEALRNYNVNVNLIKLLLDYGADIYQKNKDNCIPLRLIVYKSDINLIQLLINDDIDFEELNISNGRSIFHLAISCKNDFIFNYIMNNDNFEIDINHRDKYKNTPLMIAVSNSRTELIERIIEKNPDINAKNYALETALYIAVRNKSYKIIKLLIENGAKIDNSNIEINREMLYNAVYSFRIIQLLVKNGFEINDYIINKKSPYGQSALSQAVIYQKLQCVEFLLLNGADIYSESDYGHLPLEEIAYSFRSQKTTENIKKIIDCFVENGYDINKKNEKGIPLALAIFNHHSMSFTEDILKYLIEKHHADINIVDKDGITILMYALNKSGISIEFIQYLVEEKGLSIDVKDNMGNTALMYSLNNCYQHICSYFIEKCQDFSYKNNYGMNLLMCAIKNAELETVKLLVEKGVPINDVDNEGRNALFYLFQKIENLPKVLDNRYRNYGFIITRYRDIFKYLIDKGIDLNCERNDGQNILFVMDDITNVKYAVEHGANIKHLDHKGRSVLFYWERMNMIEYAIECGVDASLRDYEGHTATSNFSFKSSDVDRIIYLAKHGADINETKFECINYSFNYKYNMKRILEMIELNFNFDTVNSLDDEENSDDNYYDYYLSDDNDDNDNNNDVNDDEKQKSFVKETFLDYYIYNKNSTTFDDYIDILMKALDKKLFNINRKNFNGETPLLCFLRKMKRDSVTDQKLLSDFVVSMIDHGAQLEEMNKEGKTALYYALNISANLTKILYSKGARILYRKNSVTTMINTKTVLLHENCSDDTKLEIIKYLRSLQNIDLNEKIDNEYLIFIAIEQKCQFVVEYLLSENVSLCHFNNKNETVMDAAKRVGDEYIITLVSKQKEWINFSEKLNKGKGKEEEKD